MRPIGYLKSPYRQKFAIPRQPNLVKEAIGEIVFVEAFSDPNCLRGIEGFSHLWLVFEFHEVRDEGWSPTVAPPRLGGTEQVGVFASRSPYRPNALGLSVVEFVSVVARGKELRLRVAGIDLLDGTPIFDIKPYLPYADSIPHASGGYAALAPAATDENRLQVLFSAEAEAQLDNCQGGLCDLRKFITQVLQQDPRPAQHIRKNEARDYAMHLDDFNVRWRVEGKSAEVFSIETLSPEETPPWKQ